MPELELAAGRVIADRRRRAGHTQESLAEACALHPTYISQLERGLKSPTLGVLVRLAAAMGLPLSTLVRGIERELAKGSAPKPAPAKKRAPSKGIAR
jgi:transcriptional regulator with XRE-family HTH domain